MPLEVDVGHSSLTGPRERNEDFCGMVTPQGAELENKGLIAAVADGIGGHKGGREAAEYTVRGLLSDYYATPDTWSVPHALEKVVVPLNRWVMAEAGRQPELAGMATTLTTLVLRGRRYVCAHVGDSRLYLLRDGVCTRLTSDHVWEHPELKNVLSRAVGLDRHFQLDFVDGELQEGDCFLLCSDGVWGPLDTDGVSEPLTARPSRRAAGGGIADQPGAGLRRPGQRQRRRPAGARAAGGEPARLARWNARGCRCRRVSSRARIFDGLRIDEVLHDSRATLLYRVTDQLSGQQLVLKTLRPELADDADEIRALIMEEWRTRRIVSPFFAQAGTGRKTQLPLLPADLARGRDAAADARRRSAFHRRRRRPARHPPDERALRPAPPRRRPPRHQAGQHPHRPRRSPAHPRSRRRAQPVGRRVQPAARERRATWRRNCSPASKAGRRTTSTPPASRSTIC
jgi:serine/threonine protein phosphatase PrpC